MVSKYLSTYFNTPVAALEHLRRIRISILLAVIGWLLLTLEYPNDPPIPQYWTMIYAVGKFSLGWVIAYFFIRETFSKLDISSRIEKFDKIKCPEKQLNQAILLFGLLLFRAILMSVSIYVLCIW